MECAPPPPLHILESMDFAKGINAFVMELLILLWAFVHLSRRH
jgi:hypothetical protein